MNLVPRFLFSLMMLFFNKYTFTFTTQLRPFRPTSWSNKLLPCASSKAHVRTSEITKRIFIYIFIYVCVYTHLLQKDTYARIWEKRVKKCVFINTYICTWGLQTSRKVLVVGPLSSSRPVPAQCNWYMRYMYIYCRSHGAWFCVYWFIW